MRQALQQPRAWLDVFSFVRLLVVSGFATGLLLAACSSKRPVPCTNHVRSEVTSPNGRQRAIVFRRICSEDGSVSTDISIVGVDEALPDRNGNVYATDRDIAIRVAWVTENRLAVYSFADLSKGTRLEQAGSVSIEYSRVMEADLLPPPKESSPSPAAGTP